MNFTHADTNVLIFCLKDIHSAIATSTSFQVLIYIEEWHSFLLYTYILQIKIINLIRLGNIKGGKVRISLNELLVLCYNGLTVE